ncbi:P-type conjugative transfer protein TrbL [Sphingosinicella rhizophila]|uniref:P-type conjugative transfer protein TrbL n=1 Tax=Sphingosinicella rhizophila TaxID=3050082 RepID=A0ABU3QBS2_9SPHN|nr:P-type conjugative transfer protein TrbL [Sphingosinicella sp. GR2756]MDT9600400.1 P-type conjugative transfer protein TrbL [Sphingosinicella sp. GR2756]
MNDVGVIDRFLQVFSQYIDSGFGLLGGEVAFIATTLIVIDVTLAALFWTWAADDDVLARLVKKTLFVGIFAYLISNWNALARIVFESFAGLGLQAAGGTVSAADFVRPGRIAEIGIEAGRPIFESISELMGFISFFENAVQIFVMLFAWALVLLSFFILAIQLFVTLIEFKLTTLAGFVLIPFGLFGKTAFLAERVLGNVISSGVKVLVLAVIVGIGSTLFSEFTAGFAGDQPTMEDAMAIVLAALSLLGLGIFGPGIANGIVSGGPQLGAGAAVGTGAAALAVGAAGYGVARLGMGAAAGAVRGGGSTAAATQVPATRGGAGTTGMGGLPGGGSSPGGGSTGAAAAAPSGAAPSIRPAPSGSSSGPAPAAPDAEGAASASSNRSDGVPAWAKRMQRERLVKEGVSTVAHTVRAGDRGGSGSSISVSEDR